MISAPYRKALRDLSKDRGRAVMVLLALIVGVWGLTTVLASTTVLNRELRDNFLKTNPASATLWVDSVSDATALLPAHPGVKEAERRDLTVLRMQVGPDEWLPLWLYIVEDFSDVRVAKFELDKGRLPQTGEMLLERDGLLIMPPGAESAAEVVVKLPGQPSRAVAISGLVHDPGRSPSHMDHRFYGYVTRDTAEGLGIESTQQRIMITAREHPDSALAIRELAQSLDPWLSSRGAKLVRFNVPPPLRHPHQGQLESLLLLQVGIGGLAFLLSALLVFAMFSTLLSRQVKEIGIMKAIGARPRQLVGPYLAMVLVPTILAMLIAIPGGLLTAWEYSSFVAAELNFDLDGGGPPGWVVPVTVLASLALAAAAAAGPVLRGIRIGVLDALRGATASRDVRFAAALPIRSRILMLAIRNSLRNRGRMLLTAFSLSLGVATLLIGLDISASLENTLSGSANARSYDVELLFATPTDKQRISAILESAPGVAGWDLVGGGRASIELADGPSNQYTALAPATRPLLPPIEGEWKTGFVLNQELRGLLPELVVGELVEMTVNGKKRQLPFDGVVREVGSPPRIYLPTQAHSSGQASAIAVRVQTELHDIPSQKRALRDLERRMEAAGLAVVMGLAKAERTKIIEDHLIVLTTVLTFASLLVLLVGGLGVASTMSMRLLERRRELAVMRAIGATPRVIIHLMIMEGTILGALAWVAGAILSVPIAKVASSAFGQLILETPLSFVISWPGILGSAVLVIGFTAVVSAIPTSSFNRISIREALTFE